MKKYVISLSAFLLLFIAIYVLASGVTDKLLEVTAGERKLPIYCIETENPVVALTFDAAWGNEDTEILIDILTKHDAKATFFVTGDWLDRYPQDVKLFFEEGHDIANHSNDHPHINNLTAEQLAADTKKCNEKIKELTGEHPLLYRGPYGEYNNILIEMLEEQGQMCIQWDVDSLDWKDPEPEQIAKNVLQKVKNGSIILLHNGAKNTPEALPLILEGLTKKGYEFALVRDLIYYENYEIDHTGKQKELTP